MSVIWRYEFYFIIYEVTGSYIYEVRKSHMFKLIEQSVNKWLLAGSNWAALVAPTAVNDGIVNIFIYHVATYKY